MGKLAPFLVLLTLSCLALSCETISRYVFLYRPGYARMIDLEAYVMDRDQVAEIYDYSNPAKPYQKPNRELVGKRQYLVLHFKNRGRLTACCILGWRINGGPYTETEIWEMWGDYLGRAEYQVIPVGSVVNQDDGDNPEITWKTRRLFAES